MSSTTKAILLEAAKCILVLAIAVFLWSMLSSTRESNAPFTQVASSVTGAADLSTMQEGDNQMLKRLYGIDPNDFAEYCFYYPTTNMGAEEILLVKLADTAQQDAVKAAMEARIETQKNSFDGYAIPQYEMCCNYVLEVQGNYMILIVAEDPGAIRQAFLNAL